MVGARGALDHDQHGVQHKGLRQQRAAEPPAQDQQRPFRQVLVFRQAQPDSGKVGEPIAHGHPQKHPKKTVPGRDAAGMAYQVKNAIVHQHVYNAHAQPDQHRHVFFSDRAAEAGNAISNQM